MQRLVRKIHLTATAILGVQLVAWAVTGFAFTLFDFRAVRGTDDRAPAAVLPREVLPPLLGEDRGRGWTAEERASIQSVHLTMLAGRPVYAVAFAGERGERLVDAVDGQRLTIDEPLAARIATGAFRGTARALGATRRDDEGRDVWIVRLDDRRATEVAVDAATGEIAWWRNDVWRAFDTLWSIHVLGYVDRRSPAHWPLRVVGLLASVAALSGAGLLLARLALRLRRRAAPRAAAALPKAH
ncbi:PepSY domain-containing protein [Pendulispora albinea]|uniref:PepSY domain-containing protein n=1 Tax=Pendulispora albinea TaxID=2741071 RepID=A0ABZ2M0S8_9BACT